MSSIRKSLRRNSFTSALPLAALVVTGVLAGCQHEPAPAPEAVSSEPLAIDEAMQRRDWPRTEAEFQNGVTVAGSTRMSYRPQTTGDDTNLGILGSEGSNSFLDNFAFIGESLLIPITYFKDPPFVEKDSPGVMYAPTYTAMPVLPPDQSEPARTDYSQTLEGAGNEPVYSEPAPGAGRSKAAAGSSNGVAKSTDSPTRTDYSKTLNGSGNEPVYSEPSKEPPAGPAPDSKPEATPDQNK